MQSTDVSAMVSLADSTAVVTGGGGGIGGATSRLFAAAGATVVVNDIDADLAQATVADIEADGGTAVAVVGDIREAVTIEELHSTSTEVAGGAVDVLINNVGDYRPNGLFTETDEDQWAAQYEIQLHHVFRCTRTFLPAMRERGRGAIINVSTVEAFRGIPHNSTYSAFNAGVSAFTRSLAVEVGRDGIRVNCIAPDMADTLQTPGDRMLRGRDPQLIRSWIPLGRWGQPIDYAKVMLFLASELSSFMTGNTLMVDGGTMAAGGWYGRADGRGWTNLPNRA
ncbi:MAG: SDR family NAD(P)-dependent oxidoreductase [Acidimicrobiales bacterium]|nr:SDR family oxidoreductase [Actinomycetes bacterium]MDP6106529.1 SDR family NAD(P)-dependent oxidoreductase [Acidimicrobiales bacterium]MCP4844413.1 SDR family oxidoreductase [Actinomycetes bacterium]MDP6240667.1 SDR family NAD(P)-dependent oxidoreductase [Acidimicrobiales bacterium]MDP7125117.1 SDR family NAD(P)-dependent oxidoreductase [Acidimicrobiales bacterium]|tara:strand:+ start:1268 stop:2110 length:843 start_codon:yes stop_codon:yes gene_type:complete